MLAGNIFYGLRGVNKPRKSHLPRETAALLKSLTEKIKTNEDDSLEPAKISMLLFGLQNFTCDASGSASSTVVRDLLKEISSKVSTSAPGWSGRAAGTALFGLRGGSSEVEEVRTLLATLLEKFDAEEEEDFALNPQEIANALYGLQKMSSDHEEVTDILGFFRDKLMSCDARPFKAQEISNIMYGLHRMSSSEPEVRNLINVLTEKIDESTGEFTGQDIGNSLYGLQNMSSDFTEVRDLLTSLHLKVKKSASVLSPQEIGNAIYGLRHMDSTHEAVRLLLTALVDKVKTSEGSFKALEISMAIYGLKSMSSDALEVRKLIEAIGEKLDTCTETFNAQCVGNSLYGLQGMSSSAREVRLLMKQLNNKIRNFPGELSEQEIGNSLNGFQNMSNEYPEVRTLLTTLSKLIEQSSRTDMTSQAMGNALIGLKSMSMSSSHEELLHMLEVLYLMIMRSSHTFSAQAFSQALYGLKNMNSESFEVRNLLCALIEKGNRSDMGTKVEALQIANALGGLQSMSSDDAEVRQLLGVITEKFFEGENDKEMEWNQDNLGRAIYGLKNMSSNHPEVRQLLSHIGTRLSHVESPLTASQLSKVMFSLQKMRSSSPEVRNIVAVMGQHLHTVELDGQAVANCLYGLQNMSCGDAGVKDFMRQLCENIESSVTIVLSPQDIGNALYGLKSMSCEHEEVRRLLVLLCNAAVDCKQPFGAHALSTAFVGMRGCHDKHIEVTDMFFMLKQKLEAFKGTCDPLQVKNMFSGLRGMTSGSRDVQQILTMLGDKLKSCSSSGSGSGRINGAVVGEVLYGMQRMNVEHVEVRAVLNTVSELFPLVTSGEGSAMGATSGRRNNTAVGEEVFDLYSLGAALYGLASISQIHLATTRDQSFGHIMDRMKSSGVIFHLIDRVLAHGAQVSSKFVLANPQSEADYALLNDIAGIPLSHSVTLLRSLNFIEMFIPQLPATSQENLRLIRSNINTKREDLLSLSQESHSPYSPKPFLLPLVKELKSQLARHENVRIEVGSELESFETDITIKIYPDGGGYTLPVYVLNLEIEGLQHSYPTKRRFSFLRDTCLQNKPNVEVVRVHFFDNSISTDKAIAAAVRKVTEKLNE